MRSINERFYPFTQTSDCLLISPFSISLELTVMVMRILEMITNSFRRKCKENSMENMNFNVRMVNYHS